MKVGEHRDYNYQYPENFHWGHLDNHTMSASASAIICCIEDDSDTPNRFLVPGLRQALRIMAELADY